MKLQEWTRDYAANVQLALLGGVPFLGLLALYAFGAEGSMTLRIVFLMLLSADVMLALKLLAVQRDFVREDARGGDYSDG